MMLVLGDCGVVACCALVVWRPPATRQGAHGPSPSLAFIPAIVFPANNKLCMPG
jgi:hypothetical protein